MILNTSGWLFRRFARVEPDGVEFRVETLEIQKIKEDAEYEGARVRLLALVSNARVTLQIDIGLGDVIVPHAAEIEYPVLLEFAAPKLLAYSRETVVAEKLEAITVLGLLIISISCCCRGLRIRWDSAIAGGPRHFQTTFHRN